VPTVGKHTRLAPRDDRATQGRAGRAGGRLAPGKQTLVMQEAQYDEEPAPRRAPAPREPGRLDAGLQGRMSQAFGFDLSGVSIRRDSPEATGATRALVKDGEVHFREGAYQPGTREGDWLIAHELAHVVQQQGGRGERAGSRQELEREADRAATLAVLGRAAPIALRAQPAVAYAFSDSEEHAEADAASAEDGAYDPRADLAMPPVPGEGGEGGGAPGGGGGASPKPQKQPPSVAAAPPEVSFVQLLGIRPDKLVPALGQLHAAAAGDVGKQRAEAKANPPKQLSNGDGAAAQGAGVDAGAGAGAGAKGAGAGAPGGGGKQVGPGASSKADKSITGEVPGGQAAKQAQQGQAQQAQQQAGAPIAAAAQEHVWWLRAFSGKPTGAAANGGKVGGEPTMTEAEKQQMSSSLASIPTQAAGVSTDPGAAPAIAMKGEAKSASDRDRAKLEAQAAKAEAQGRTDSRVPLGEDRIETSVPTEELTAKAVPGRAAPEVALPTVAGAAPSEEVAIVAQEQSGAQIDAALAKASADVATERAKHAREDQKARAEADQQIRDLKTKADADQAAARAAAKAESEQARGQWQAEIDKQGADARKQADKKVAEGMAQVTAEEAKANAEAQKHIEEGKQKAEAAKQKGEQEAETAKAKGQKKSSGFFGWLSSKAKAFFAGIKKAISAAIDAARKAVKAVLDAAKRLAMAAIELARKAITAAIQAIGEALLAITDVLLAAFPALKARFQAAIRAAVNKAVTTVNKLAEGLKQAVQAALDRLGKALDAALALLEKGLHALVDLVGDVVQGAIDAAKAIVDALGAWAKIIKDVATGPGAWIGKLGAAVVDGIKHHLWSAFKTAVVAWFKSKVIEVLGVAGMILQVLLEGGITMDDIVQMALDALLAAIPMALVAILIEKLVAMIVPAAGALMAIIEGLQAAWGTVSRIIAAFAAFMAFLSAVQGGGAGPLFATALASAAVVVLDFVANWLLKKLRGPAAKVGKKLEGIAARLKRKGKGADAKQPKKKRDDHGGPDERPAKNPDKDDKKGKQEESLAQKEARLQKAVAEVKRLTKGGKGIGLLLRARLWNIKRKYKLSELSATKQPGKAHIYDVNAVINPKANFEVFALKDDADALRVRIEQLFETIKDKDVKFPQIEKLAQQALAETLGTGRGYQLHWIHLDDRHVLMLKNSKSDTNPTPVGAAVYQDEYDKGTPGPAGHLVYMNKRTATEYVKDQVGQYVPRKIVRAITDEDEHFIKIGKGILPKSDPDYLKKFPFEGREKAARDPHAHAVGGKLSPYISTTKQQDGEITNPHGEKFDGRGDGAGKVRIDLAYIAPKNIHDLSTRQGQDFWNFSHPAVGTAAMQALKDVVRTSEVLVRGTIPGKAILERF